MQASKYFIHMIRIIVTDKERPVTLNAQMPANFTKVIGIKAHHCVGLNVYEDLSLARNGFPSFTNSSIGWFHLEFNNRATVFGNLDVQFNPEKLISKDEGEFIKVDIPLGNMSMVTGIYNNVFNPDHYLLNNKTYPWLSATTKILPAWLPYILTLSLQCEKRND